jgi:S1-C subfamily serine protease
MRLRAIAAFLSLLLLDACHQTHAWARPQSEPYINPGMPSETVVQKTRQTQGMNTAVLNRGDGSVEVDSANPAEVTRTAAQEFKGSGKLSCVALGVTVQDVTPHMALGMGLNVTGINVFSGALVSEVRPGSPAAHAGIKKGDVITQWSADRRRRLAERDRTDRSWLRRTADALA